MTDKQTQELCGKRVYNWTCKLPKGHKGDHDYHQPKAKVERT